MPDQDQVIVERIHTGVLGRNTDTEVLMNRIRAAFNFIRSNRTPGPIPIVSSLPQRSGVFDQTVSEKQ